MTVDELVKMFFGPLEDIHAGHACAPESGISWNLYMDSTPPATWELACSATSTRLAFRMIEAGAYWAQNEIALNLTHAHEINQICRLAEIPIEVLGTRTHGQLQLMDVKGPFGIATHEEGAVPLWRLLSGEVHPDTLAVIS